MSATAVATPAPHDLEEFRGELTRFCSRRLGSWAEADDAVQETMIRAWRFGDTFQGRASLRSWLYRIAINVCLDVRVARNRRPLPVDPTDVLVERDETYGVASAPDPVDVAADREAVREAFTAVVRHLPARQRAVIVLHDVLRWRAREIAGLLGATEASVNSASQRAKATLRLRAGGGAHERPLEPAGERLVEQCVAAFVAYDVDALVALLRADALTAART